MAGTETCPTEEETGTEACPTGGSRPFLLDCHASLAMTRDNGWIATLRSQWRHGRRRYRNRRYI